ncbi:Alkylated DNA repair protein alkB-like protein 1, partial [Zootermopsis nevadensis]
VNFTGLLFIPNPFTAFGQRYWVCRCLKDFTCKPQKLNLDKHGDLEDEQKWWDTCLKDAEKGKILLQKLRWATLGYHHNWDTKKYSEDSRDPFPQDLATLCQYVATAVGFDDFRAQAAIVNYYHMDSTLSGHTDHSEPDNNSLLSFGSFGQSAVFLIGGPSADEKPTAMLIHSGDIVIMSGASRLCYHGIPRIVSADTSPWNDANSSTDLSSEIIYSCMENNFWEPFGNYLKTSRINMNVRQVLKLGVRTLPQRV